MEPQRRNQGAIVVMAALLTSVLAVGMPGASAHTCKSYSSECDPNGCTEGQAHEHTKQNYVGRDEYCKSEKEEKKGKCDDKALVEKLICLIVGGALTDAVAAVPAS